MAKFPGLVGLLGSGENTATGGQLFETIAQNYLPPISACVLETPAGFEQNSRLVAGKVTDYINSRLKNFLPKIIQIPAREKGFEGGLDNPELLAPILSQNMIFFGPGSPSYTVRQLSGSMAWSAILAAHEAGASIITASAASIALGKYALPVYEIYKVGDDPYWKTGLDFFAKYNLHLVIVPHWNNTDGGEDLDTSRCFMGKIRFAKLVGMLPSEVKIIGIDEHTGLVIDFEKQRCVVTGKGAVHVFTEGKERLFEKKDNFPLQHLGDLKRPERFAIVPEEILHVLKNNASQLQDSEHIPVEISGFVKLRENARNMQDWQEADRIREQLATTGWQVTDTKEGHVITKIVPN